MDIAQIIQEAATWIEKVNPDYDVNLYRTDVLKPKRNFYDTEVTEMPGLVGDLVRKRFVLLQQSDKELIPVNELHQYGRVVLFNAWETFTDGAPEVESDYYVDIYDTPPHDTWIALGSQLNDIEFYTTWRHLDENVLLAWVPQAKYYCAKGAIEVACVDNFAWATNQNISPKYHALSDVFSEPLNIVTNSPHVKAVASWHNRLDKYVKELDKVSVPPVPPILPKPPYVKNAIWNRLFGR